MPSHVDSEFERIKYFVATFGKKFLLSQNCTRVSVVLFGSSPNTAIPFQKSKDLRSFLKAASKMKPPKPGYDFAAALLYTHMNLFMTENRLLAQQILLMVLKGK